MKVVLKAVVLSSLVSALAFAQPGGDDPSGNPTDAPVMPPTAPPPAGPPPTAMPVMAPPPPAPEPAKVDKGTVEDANAGRAWLTPTALTEPAGTWSFSDYELFLVSLGYSPTDQLSLSATTLLPVFGSDQPFWLLVNGKYQLIREGKVRLAAQGAITYVSDGDNDSATAGVLGGALTLCLDDDCRSWANGYIGAGFSHQDQSGVPLVLAGSLALAVNHHVKLLVEADTGYMAGGEFSGGSDAVLGWYGVRFTSSIIGVDLGFIKPLCDGCSSDDLPMGFPFVSFTYRSL